MQGTNKIHKLLNPLGENKDIKHDGDGDVLVMKTW